MNTLWTRAEALALLAVLSEKLAPRYHPALAGSVLIKGASDKDLDIVVYPNSTDDVDMGFVATKLGELGLTKLHDVEVVHARWRRLGSRDAKHVEVWDYHGKRVDVFFLS